MRLFDSSFTSLDVALGAAGLRQQVLSNNLANVNTPGFKRSDVQFDSELDRALSMNGSESSRINALRNLEILPEVDGATSMRADGNNVDVDMEMANLAENNVRYNALVQVAAKQLGMLSYVISDGRR